MNLDNLKLKSPRRADLLVLWSKYIISMLIQTTVSCATLYSLHISDVFQEYHETGRIMRRISLKKYYLVAQFSKNIVQQFRNHFASI